MSAVVILWISVSIEPPSVPLDPSLPPLINFCLSLPLCLCEPPWVCWSQPVFLPLSLYVSLCFHYLSLSEKCFPLVQCLWCRLSLIAPLFGPFHPCFSLSISLLLFDSLFLSIPLEFSLGFCLSQKPQPRPPAFWVSLFLFLLLYPPPSRISVLSLSLDLSVCV